MKLPIEKETGWLRLLLPVIILLILAFFPLLLQNKYILDLLILSNIFALYAASWNILSGYAGQISLGHAAFFGLGGYFYGFLISWYNIHPAYSILTCGVLVAVISLLVAVPCLRLRGPYFALGTLAFSETIRTVILAFPQITKGQEGMGVNYLVKEIINNYYVSFVLLIVCFVIIQCIVERRLKLYLTAIRENEELAQAVGLNTTKYKILIFLISSFFCAVTGGFYASYIRVATPRTLTVDMSFRALAISLVGGMGTIVGPVLGAYLYVFSSEIFKFFFVKGYEMIFAIILALFAILNPKGVIGLIQKLKTKED